MASGPLRNRRQMARLRRHVPGETRKIEGAAFVRDLMRAFNHLSNVDLSNVASVLAFIETSGAEAAPGQAPRRAFRGR